MGNRGLWEVKFCLQFWNKNFDPVKERIQFVPLWIRIPGIPIELWNELILKHILSPIGNLIRMYHKSEEVSKGFFVRVCVQVDISKHLKRKLKYFFESVIYECLLDYENITNICFGCGSQSHKFDSCTLNSKNIAIELRNFKNLL